MNFRKCCVVFNDGKVCDKTFFLNEESLIYCDFHFNAFNKNNRIELYKIQYENIKKSNLSNARKENILKLFYTQLSNEIDKNVNPNDIIHAQQSCICRKECPEENIYNLCFNHIIELMTLARATRTPSVSSTPNVSRPITRSFVRSEEIKTPSTQSTQNMQSSVSGYIFPNVYEITFSSDDNRFEKPFDCPVCFCEIEDEKKPLSCGHWVHINCVEQWQRTQKLNKPKCPVCRAEITTNDDEKEKIVTINIQKKVLESEAISLLLKAANTVMEKINKNLIPKIFQTDTSGVIDKVIKNLVSYRF